MTAKRRNWITGQYIIHSQALISSPAWRGRSHNLSRLLDFLELEHMAHGGKDNGRLLAPWNQLVQFGIGRRFVADVVDEGVERGLLDVRKGVGRAPSNYTITYLPTFASGEENAPSDRWRAYEPVAVHLREPQRCTKVNHKTRSGSPKCTTTPVAVHLSEVHEGEHLSREESYHGGAAYSVVKGEAA